jgi:hypothetical protein
MPSCCSVHRRRTSWGWRSLHEPRWWLTSRRKWSWRRLSLWHCLMGSRWLKARRSRWPKMRSGWYSAWNGRRILLRIAWYGRRRCAILPRKWRLWRVVHGCRSKDEFWSGWCRKGQTDVETKGFEIQSSPKNPGLKWILRDCPEPKRLL